MSGNMKVCDIDADLREALTAFRFRKDLSKNAAIIMKVDREKHTVILDQELEDITIEDLVEALPGHQPRYVVLSYKMEHKDDARVSYPLCFIFITPRDCNPELQMMYAGSKLSLQKEVDLTRTYELRELEELTEEWLQSKLSK